MARPREFDVDVALERAMQAFWTHGYESTSLSDLMDTMDLQKGSIYKAFGDKHSLFISALKHYLNQVHQFDRKMIETADSPRDGIRNWLNTDLKNTCGQKLKRGCLMVNALCERAYKDNDVADLIKKHTSKLSKLLTNTIKQGQNIGEFRKDFDASEISQIIIVSLFGMLTLSKGPMSKNASLQNAKNILKMIEK